MQIHAGRSGFGSAAVQLARLVGANVITTAGSDEKVEKAKALRVHYGINYKAQDFLHEVRRITKKGGGEEAWERSLLCLTAGGRLVTCGATSGYLPKTNPCPVFFRNLQILGVTSGSKASLFGIAQLAHEGKLQARPGPSLAFEGGPTRSSDPGAAPAVRQGRPGSRMKDHAWGEAILMCSAELVMDRRGAAAGFAHG